MPICRLCLEDRVLVDAHIIPRAFWSLPPASEDAAKIISESTRPAKTRKGIYDQNILCAHCDVWLGQLDQHAAEALLQIGPSESIGFERQALGRVYSAADPKIMEKFISSVVWRASVSQHDFFRAVSLGPYETTIRNWLKDQSDFPCGIGAAIAEFDEAQVPMLDPHKTRTDGVRFWVIYAHRFIFYLKTDQQSMPNGYEDFELKAGRRVVSIVRSFKGSKEGVIHNKLAKANSAAFRSRRK